MPVFEFTGPDGQTYEVEAPEGATEQQAFATLREHLGAVVPQEQNYNTPVGTASLRPSQYAEDARPTSFTEGVQKGVMTPWNNLAALLEAGAEKLGIADPMNWIGQQMGMAPSVGAAEANQAEAQAASPNRPSAAGEFVGNMIGTAPAMAVPGGVLAQGGAAGAMLTDDRSVGGVLTDAGIGAVGGKVGDSLVRGVANAANPVVQPVVQRLKDAGIPLTPGQIMGAGEGIAGRAAKAVEDRLAGLPFIGDVITAARVRGNEAFNRAAVSEALKPIGVELPKGVQAGHHAVRFAGDRLSDAYEEVLPKLNAKADQQFVDDLVNIAGEVETMVQPRAEQLGRIIQADVRRFVKPDGTITGDGLKQIESRLGSRIRKFEKAQDPDAADLGDALKSVQMAVREMAARQNPTHAPRLRSINEGWANLVRVERAATQGKEGIFSPNQLKTAVRQSDSTARKRGTARGEARMQQFAEDAQSVLPSSIPDSGTAGRLLVGGAGLGMVNADDPRVQAMGALTLGASGLYTKPGQKAAEWALTGRQGPVATQIGNSFRALVPLTPLAGAATNAASQ